MSNDDKASAIAKRQHLLAGAVNDGNLEDVGGGPDDVLDIGVTVTASILLECGGPTTEIRYRFNRAGEFISAHLMTTDTPSGRPAVADLDDDEAEQLAEFYTFGLDNLADHALARLHESWPGAFDSALG